jgi:hypothetical protein
MPRPRTTRPQNLGQNRNVQMRNNARRPNTFGQQAFQGGLQQPGQQPGQEDMRCPTGQKPVKGPDGKMTCAPAAPRMPKGPNRGY